MPLVGLLELRAAIRLHGLAAHFVQAVLRDPERLLRDGQFFRFCDKRKMCVTDALLCSTQAVGPHVKRLSKLCPLFAPRPELRTQFNMAVFEPLASLFDMTKLGLVPGDFGIRAVQCGLSRVQSVPGRIVRSSRGFYPAFSFAQACGFRLQLVCALDDLLGMPLALGCGIAAAQEPEQLLLHLEVAVKFLVSARNLRLLFQLLDLGAQLGADIGHTRKVVARIRQPVLRLPAPFLVL